MNAIPYCTLDYYRDHLKYTTHNIIILGREVVMVVLGEVSVYFRTELGCDAITRGGAPPAISLDPRLQVLGHKITCVYDCAGFRYPSNRISAALLCDINSTDMTSMSKKDFTRLRTL